MNTAVKARLPMAPLAAVAAAGVLLLPAAAGTPTPYALADELLNRTETAATTLLAATSPLQLAAVAVSPEVQAAAFTQIFAGFSGIITNFAESIIGSPEDVVAALGNLITGEINLALVSLGGILTNPLTGSQDQLRQITGGLAQLFPESAAGFQAISDGIPVPVIALLNLLYVGGIGGGLQAVYDGVTDGLVDGDLVAAFTGFVAGVNTLIANTSEAITGADTGFGLIPVFTEYFQAVAAAFAQTPPVVPAALTALPEAAVPPASAEQSTTQLVTVATVSVPSTGTEDVARSASGNDGNDHTTDAAAATTGPADDAAPGTESSDDVPSTGFVDSGSTDGAPSADAGSGAEGGSSGGGGSLVRHAGSAVADDDGPAAGSGSGSGTGTGTTQSGSTGGGESGAAGATADAGGTEAAGGGAGGASSAGADAA